MLLDTATVAARSSAITADLRCRKRQSLAIGAVSRSCCKRPVRLTCSQKTRGTCIICNELLNSAGVYAPDMVLGARVERWQIDHC